MCSDRTNEPQERSQISNRHAFVSQTFRVSCRWRRNKVDLQNASDEYQYLAVEGWYLSNQSHSIMSIYTGQNSSSKQELNRRCRQDNREVTVLPHDGDRTAFSVSSVVGSVLVVGPSGLSHGLSWKRDRVANSSTPERSRPTRSQSHHDQGWQAPSKRASKQPTQMVGLRAKLVHSSHGRLAFLPPTPLLPSASSTCSSSTSPSQQAPFSSSNIPQAIAPFKLLGL